jgi:hypothetical protein
LAASSGDNEQSQNKHNMKRANSNDNNNNKRQAVIVLDEDSEGGSEDAFLDEDAEDEMLGDPKQMDIRGQYISDNHYIVLNVRQAMKVCRPHTEIMLYDSVMRASNRRFALGVKDDNITKLTERIYRHIDSLPEAEQLPFSRRLLEEAVDCAEIAQSNLAVMKDKESALRSVYASNLFALLKLCMRYELPLRLAMKHKKQSYIVDTTTTGTIYVTLNGLKLKHDKVTADAAHDAGFTIPRPVPFNITTPRESLCVMSNEGTIVKWVCAAFNTHPHFGAVDSVFILPPLMLRSILAAERRFHWFGVYLHLIRMGKMGTFFQGAALPPTAMRLVGLYFHKMVKKDVGHRISSQGKHYYPTLTDGTTMVVNRLHVVSAFRKEQLSKVIKFVA